MKNLITKILKAKAKKKLSLDEYIDKICAEFAKVNHAKISDEVQNLYLFILENFKISKDELIELINTKIEKIQLETAINSEEIYLKIKGENAKIAPNLSSSFDSVDFKAIKLIDDSFYWLGIEWNESVQDRLKSTIKEFMSGDISRKDIAASLAEKLGGAVGAKASVSYFEGVADNIINQNRNLNMVLNADEEVKFFKVMARMDDKTSAICRSMHGRLIPAKHLQKQAKNLLNAKSMDEKKNAAVWMSGEYLGRSDKMPSDFGLPPYHFHCRTMIVPVYVNKNEDTGETYTGVKGENEVIRHIDKMGVERILTKENYHNDNHTEPLDKRATPSEIIKALNSIIQIAPNNKKSQYTNAITQNGFFIVFNGNEIVTYKKFSDKKQLEKYFKNGIISDKKEVIKWNIVNFI
ncbi:MAG: hypothetical protein J6M14_01585 [Campylobacter sp.]|nr:hypothetical protein [Campylobacter sp.]